MTWKKEEREKNDQLCEMQDPEQVTYSAETRYTSLVLLEAVKASLEKAKPKATPEASTTPTATTAVIKCQH